MSTPDPRELFSDRNLDEVLEERRAALRQEIEGSDADAIDTEVLVRKHSIEEIRLADKVTTTSVSKEVDAAEFPNTWAHIKGESCPVWGLEVTYHVPFRGAAWLLECESQVRSRLPILARLSESELQFAYECLGSAHIGLTASRFEDDFRVLKEIVRHINGKVREFNHWLPATVDAVRSDRVQVHRQLSMLGYPAQESAAAKGRGSSLQTDRTTRSRTMVNGGQSGSHQIALSYASEDREWARQIAEQLRHKGVRVFDYEDEQAVLWGKDLSEELGVVFGGGSDFVLMLISEHYVRKIWTTHERKHAQAHALSTKSDYILPARLDGAKVPGMPSTVAYQDLRNITVERLVELILEKLGTRSTE